MHGQHLLLETRQGQPEKQVEKQNECRWQQEERIIANDCSGEAQNCDLGEQDEEGVASPPLQITYSDGVYEQD